MNKSITSIFVCMFLVTLSFIVRAQSYTTTTCSKYVDVFSSANVNYYPSAPMYDSITVYAYPWDTVVIRGQTFQCPSNEIVLEKIGVGFIDSLPTPAYFNIYTSGVYAVHGDGIIATNIKITFLNPTSIEEAISQNLNIFPNPNHGRFNITCENPILNSTIEITNAFGKVVYNQQFRDFNNISVDLGSEAPGVYLVRLVSRNKSNLQKIIIY